MSKAERFATEWWECKGRLFDPDTDDVPLQDKLPEMMRHAFMAGFAQAGNYHADEDTCPSCVTFASGIIVRLAHVTDGGTYLVIERAKERLETAIPIRDVFDRLHPNGAKVTVRCVSCQRDIPWEEQPHVCQ